MQRPARENVLIVGPLPPPMGGAPVTVKEMTEELAKDPALRVTVINTAPRGDIRKTEGGVNMERLCRLAAVFAEYIRGIRRASVVLVFANDFFAMTVVPPLLMIARLFHKHFFVKPIGGDLDVYLAGRRGFSRRYLRKALGSVDGIFAQTRQLQSRLSGFGFKNVYFLPGCRHATFVPQHSDRAGEKMRLLFLAHVIEEKGALVLLKALELLPLKTRSKVACDFYGPIHDSVREEFLSGLDRTSCARYCGEAPPGSGSDIMAAYDALVLPTFFPCEGHPGVIIEAMHAGVAVVSTTFRAIPELVTSGENGILVPVRDPDALSAALTRMAEDPSLTRRMGEANRRRAVEFRTDTVVGKMKGILFARS
jgi:glycosyltransferase involved in cell wall biosynthesis